jgi:hypothetical protein
MSSADAQEDSLQAPMDPGFGPAKGVTALPCARTRLPGPLVYWPKVYREGRRHHQPIDKDTVFPGNPEWTLMPRKQ